MTEANVPDAWVRMPSESEVRALIPPGTFPHPFITHSMERFATLSAAERDKVRFIHLNHTNPALDSHSEARRTIESNGFHVAEELERIDL